MDPRNQIPGAEQLFTVFGSWPSFHDAEVLWLHLDRHVSRGGDFGPAADAQIHVFEMTKELDANRYYVLRNHVLVHFRFFEIDRLQLDGFNHQNVIDGLDLIPCAGANCDDVCWEVRFPASHGMYASFRCAAIEVVSVVPCTQEGELLSGAEHSPT